MSPLSGHADGRRHHGVQQEQALRGHVDNRARLVSREVYVNEEIFARSRNGSSCAPGSSWAMRAWCPSGRLRSVPHGRRGSHPRARPQAEDPRVLEHLSASGNEGSAGTTRATPWCLPAVPCWTYDTRASSWAWATARRRTARTSPRVSGRCTSRSDVQLLRGRSGRLDPKAPLLRRLPGAIAQVSAIASRLGR